MLASNSVFWRHMSIANVSIQVNTKQTPPVFTSVPPDHVLNFWEGLRSTITNVKLFLFC